MTDFRAISSAWADWKALMATTNDLKNGLVLNIDGQLWTVVDFNTSSPARAAPSFVRN